MAAYAALLTLMHTIEQIQQHPRPPISLDKNQVISLTEKLTLLQEILESGRYTNEAAVDGLESRIADAACAAQDIIESHLVDEIFAETAAERRRGEEKFHERLQKVVDDVIKQKVVKVEIKETTTTTTPLIQGSREMHSWNPLRSSFKAPQNVVVVGDDVLDDMLDKLTGQEPMRQVIPISGMGGIGKTTLAKHVYSNPLIREHFDVCAWATISQQYNLREIIVEILTQTSGEDLVGKSESDLKEKLYKFLVGRRYLIILDDLWDIETWDKIRFFFPDSNNRSRVVITTRLSSLASQVNNGSYCLKMKFLDEVQSWNLFRKVVFGEENNGHLHHHLEGIGKKIARGCKGLPLSICVVGGLLAKSKDEAEYWDYLLENLNSVVNLQDNEHCLKLLHISYSQLPAHLKPCFLHMGVFAEDEKIRVSKLVMLWVGEGFLKPIGDKALEVVAHEYFNELIERNLISVHSLGSVGAIKYCNIHDLLRDFCLRQAQKERFDIVVTKPNYFNVPRGRERLYDRRFLVDQKTHKYLFRRVQHASSLFYYYCKNPLPPNSRLLRIWERCHQSFLSRYGYSVFHIYSMHEWMVFMEPSEIWNMPHLRHVIFELPNPPDGDHGIVLGNLQKLSRIKNFKCSEEMIKRIPNIKKLEICIAYTFDDQEASRHCIHDIDRLSKLESFHISFLPVPIFWQSLTFPNSLKKLSITGLSAEEVLDKIGALPHLVKLKLFRGIFGKGGWETVEGQFRSLRFLQIKECYKLGWWKTESSHFPHLEHLILWDLHELNEIPSDIGDIPTLGVIHVRVCCDTVVTSAKKIQEEQQDLGNEDLQVLI